MGNYKHCCAHNGKFTWQLSILGHPCRTSAHFDTPEEAAVSVDLVKFYLRTEFKLDLPASLDGDVFSDLAYSRRHVDLSNSRSVFQSMPEDVRGVITELYPRLIHHRDSAPPETVASKFRRSGMISDLRIRDWVEALELAESDAAAFSAVDSDSFFLRLKVVAASLTTALKSLKLAIKMHSKATNPRLVQRGKNLAELVHNFQLNLDYVEELTETLKTEQAAVLSAVATLESARPILT